MQVRCLHCHEPIQLADESDFSAIACPACGSSFSLAGEHTVSYKGGTVRSIGHFELIEQLGFGAFGSVWKARDTQLDRPVAVKIPRKGELDADETEQFLREARAAAQLRHPNIIGVHEVGREDDQVFIVSDYVRGATLDDWLSGQQLSARESAELCAKIAGALEHAHEAGVIHRDLKPSNIMLDLEGEPHLMDFGLARRISGEVTMTVEGRVLGTPAYMSPEQARGEGHRADRRADIYSLGVILFKLLTGELPFRGNPQMLLVQIEREEPPSPRKLNSRVPRDLETICLKCLEKTPDKRYATASDLTNDLRRFLNNETISARPVGRLERSWRWVRRHPARAGFIAACSVSLLALVGVAVGYAYQQELATAYADLENTNAILEKPNRNLAPSLDETNKARKDAERFQYFQRIAAANAAWQEADMGRVDRLLDDCPPDYQRNWEWRYLKRQCHTELFTPARHESEWITGISWSPDGTKLATGGQDPSVKIWDAATGNLLQNLPHEHELRDVTFSPDGTRVASATFGNPGSVHVWSVATGHLLFPPKEAGRCVAFSPDGKLLAAGPLILDAETGEEISRTERVGSDASGNIMKVAFDPTGEKTALGGLDPLRIWNVTEGRDLFDPMPLPDPDGQPVRIWSVAYSPDGTRVAAAGQYGMLAIWEANTGQELLSPFAAHESRIGNVEFSPDGRQLATASSDFTVKIWDTVSGRLRRTLKRPPELAQGSGKLFEVAYSPDGRLLAVGGADEGVQIHSATTDPEATVLKGHDGVACVAISPDAASLASMGRDGRILIWDRPTGQVTHKLPGHGSTMSAAWPKSAVTFSPDGTLLASAGVDGKVRTWDTETGRPLLAIDCGAGEVYDLAFSPSGDLVAAACEDGALRVLNIGTGQLQKFPRPQVSNRNPTPWYYRLLCVAFSADGRLIASANSFMAAVWDAATGELVHHFPAPDLPQGFYQVHGVAFGGGEQLLAATFPSIRIWDLNSGNEVLPPITGHREVLRGLAVSPDGLRIASASEDRTVRVWDMAAGEPLLVLRGHTKTVNDVMFSEDGNWLVSASDDGSIRLYDARPLTVESPIEREALSTLEFLFNKPLSNADALTYLKECPAMRPEAREVALELISRYQEETDPVRYYEAARDTVSRPYLNEYQYRFALLQARHACRLDSSQQRYKTALAAAQYRVRQYDDALATLNGGERTEDNSLADLALLALTQHQLGGREGAQDSLADLRWALGDSPEAGTAEMLGFIREAEALLTDGETQREHQ